MQKWRRTGTTSCLASPYYAIALTTCRKMPRYRGSPLAALRLGVGWNYSFAHQSRRAGEINVCLLATLLNPPRCRRAPSPLLGTSGSCTARMVRMRKQMTARYGPAIKRYFTVGPLACTMLWYTDIHKDAVEAPAIASVRTLTGMGEILDPILWAVVSISGLSFIKTLLDALNKSVEAEEAHAKHQQKPLPQMPQDPSRSPKEKVELVSFMFGFSASLLGLIFSGAKAAGNSLTAALVVWGVALISALFVVAWGSWYYSKTHESNLWNRVSRPWNWWVSRVNRDTGGSRTPGLPPSSDEEREASVSE